MCGIVAVYCADGLNDRQSVARGLAALHHRGPDHAGSWFSRDGRVALGHTLLAVTDVGGGRQPIVSADGSRAITVNGEFYAWEELRDRLVREGYCFQTGSDSEVALHLHHLLGPASLSSLRGEFAYILWDSDQRSLFAARDRYGICPLLYAQHEGRVYFASEAKALFAMGVPARWDEESVYLQTHGLLAPGRTLFAGVRQLPPGHFLTLGAGGMVIQRYWDLDLPTVEGTPELPAQGAAEAVREALVEAVRLRIPGSGISWGVYLSGGVDSSAVAGIVAREAGLRVPAYTIRFDHVPYDESAVARRTAEALGLDLIEVHASGAAMADVLDTAVVHTESLVGNLGPAGKLLLSGRARADGLRVVITGEGADEVFPGYDEMWPGPEEWRSEPCLAYGYRVLGSMPEWLGGAVLKGQAERDLLSGATAERFAGFDALRSFLDAFDVSGSLDGRAPLDQSLYLWARSALPNFLLRALGDGCERANSIEARLPMLDHSMAEISVAVRGPPEASLPARTKQLLRDAARPFLTDEVFHAPKWPFMAPPVSLDPAGPLRTRLGDILHSRALDELPFANAPALRRRFERLGAAEGMAQHAPERTLQRFASACVLQQSFHLS